jgi:menaquinone-specific isochorismate synthase
MNITHDDERLKMAAAEAARSRLILPFVTAVSIPPIDIPAWLQSMPGPPTAYWCDREKKIEIGGVGAAVRLPRRAVGDGSGRFPDDAILFPSFYVFDPQRQSDPAWRSFHPDDAWFAEMLILRKGNEYSFQHCLPVPPDADLTAITTEISRVVAPEGQSVVPTPESYPLRPTSIAPRPDYNDWRTNVNKVLHHIAAGRVKKVVLARRIDYTCDRPVEPWSLFLTLREHHPNSYAIFHRTGPGVAFLSFTPERLYRRDGRSLAVDALSSTVLRGRTPEEDRRLEEDLQGDEKQNREHRFVVDGVTARLNPVCRERPRIGGTSVMKLARIQHLWTPITGILKETVTDDTVVAALHPTPAMGGTPRQEAMGMIRRLEPFDRGLYAAPWGYAGRDEAEYAVAIRSALVSDRVISVFTGAGIVAGSDPEREWRELNDKDILRPLIDEGEHP